MHADDFRNDNYGVVSGLRDGGYSDDMTLAAIAGNALIYLIFFVTFIEPVYLWTFISACLMLCV